jgi:hypothetical protein
MKLSPLLLPAVCLNLLVFSAVSARSQTVITFDDTPVPFSGTNIPNGYQGLNWNNFGLANPSLQFNGVRNGYYYGMVSLSNDAFNDFAYPAEIDSAGTNFNFLSTYLTGAWNSNLIINVEGFRSGALVYDTAVVAAATNATLFTFNYLDIDRLYFDAFGGAYAGFGGEGPVFVMDNFMFEFIPEPSTFLLAALGAVSLVAFLRRKRA